MPQRFLALSTSLAAHLLLVVALAVSCRDAPPPQAPAAGETAGANGGAAVAPARVAGAAGHGGATHGPTPGIDWFPGEIDQAFARARSERKPVFLYWGATWCPPCHYLKTKVFTRPAFQARMRNVVPVYLDGDTERAQILGEKYRTQGYPTVIVFDPEGREVTRLPSMLPLDEYGEALDRALSSARPIADVLAAVERSGPAAASASDLGQLAFYAWDQDASLDLPADRREALFRRLWRESPQSAALERQRFLGLYLGAVADRAAQSQPAASGGKAGPAPQPALGEADRAEVLAALLALLGDPEARRTNLDLVLYRLDDVVPVVTPHAGADRDRLLAAWNDAARSLESDETLAIDDRLSALFPQIAIARLRARPASPAGAKPAAGTEPAPPLPAELVGHVRERIRWADGAVGDESELQAVMSTMAGLLEEAGLRDEAKTLLSSRMADTVAPYYYLSHLASLEEEGGDPAKAVALYRQAWQQTTGAMTRFRWGSNYLRRAMKLEPASAPLEGDVRTIVGELVASPDAFSGGNWMRLEGLGTALGEWNAGGAHAATVEAVRATVHDACARFPDDGDDSPRDRCASFLAKG